MKLQDIQTATLANGLTLIVETMTDVQSAAFSLLVPAGSVFDLPGHNGTASILSDLITRGAGNYSSKQLSAALDNLGVQRHESVSSGHLALGGAMLAESLPEAMRIYGDILRQPLLPEDQFDAAAAGVEQSLRSIEDEPRQKVMLELRRRCYPEPWGRPTEGSLDDLPNITAETVRDHYERCFRPNDTILGIAGNVRMENIQPLVEDILGNWERQEPPMIETGPRGLRRDHLSHESTQTQIGVAYDAVPYRSPDYYAAWAAVSVLSGGMSSRLFTEVREKRGLCYSVYATLSTLRDEGRVLCYAGTTVERAQETLDVTLRELVRLGEGIAPEELERCKARAKSALIMAQESTSSRASSLARDWYHLGRVTTLSEVNARIDALTVESVLEYVRRHPARDFTILTIGPQPLEVML